MDLTDKKIGFAITGSFCTFDTALKMLKELVAINCTVIPIFSPNVCNTDTRFYNAKDFYNEVVAITKREPISTIEDAEPLGPKEKLDLLIIAPCTGNTLAKINYGITDTSVTMSAKSHLRNGKPLLLGISTNDGLSNNAKNIGQLLNVKNVFFMPFRQDDPINKPTSTIADFSLLIPSIEQALQHKQIQPILI